MSINTKEVLKLVCVYTIKLDWNFEIFITTQLHPTDFELELF